MSYVTPKVRVFQEFQTIPTEITAPLRAFILGPQGRLHRYSNASEKLLASLGDYDPTDDTAYSWPDKKTGSLVDTTFTKLYVDNGLLKYFTDAVGVGSTIAPVTNKPNRIRSSSVIFQTANDFDHSASLLDRGVKTGDRVYVRGTSDSVVYELNSYVRGFAYETTASEIASASREASNATAQGYAISIDKIAGADNNVTVEADGSSYDGRVDGDIDEYYTIEVIQGSTGSDFTTAILKVTSASGNDNDSSVIPSGTDAFTSIGTRNLLVKFSVNAQSSGSSAADLDTASPNDLVYGQKYRVHVQQAFTVPTATSSGTYTGEQDTVYIVEVTKGGAYDEDPEITVSTNTGYDFAAPVKVSATATAVAVGNYGVLAAFNSTGLNKGDKYTISVTAEADGEAQTLILGHPLPDELLDSTDLHLELYIRKSFQIGENRIGFAPEVNWEQSSTEFTVKSAIVAYESTWTDNGEEQALDLVSGDLYVEYREWLYTGIDGDGGVGVAGKLSDPAEVVEALGSLTPDNPLAYGVYQALITANGTDVYYTAVSDPTDIDAWALALDNVVGAADDYYNIVPMSNDKAVQALVVAHCLANSGPDQGRWRSTFIQLVAKEKKVICSAASSDDDEVIMAKLLDDPETSGTQYTLLSVTSGNIEFVEAGVRPGDIVRFLFTSDGFGSETWTEFVVDEVRSEHQLVVATGHTVAITTALKVEIWRNQSKTEIATDLAQDAGAYGSSRVCPVWPDKFMSGGREVPGYFLCANLAGLRSGVVPHQGLTNVEMTGVDSVERTTEFFAQAHLDIMAESGAWIVTQNRQGQVFTRHALTSDTTDVNSREEMIRVNVDSMSYVFLSAMRPFIGRANVTPTALQQIETTLQAVIEFLKSNGFTTSLGSQLIDGEVISVKAHAIEKDRVEAYIRLTVPAPLNYLDQYLFI